VLIEQLIGAADMMLVERTLRFGPAKSCAIGICEFSGCFPLGSLLEAFQIDHVGHNVTHHRLNRQRASPARRARMHEAIRGSITIKNKTISLLGCGSTLIP
jgi:hypothetical protein